MANWDFPIDPVVGQIYSFGGKSWQWNGSGWQVRSMTDELVDEVKGYRDDTQALYDQFIQTFLGSLSADPVSATVGAMYYNTTDDIIRQLTEDGWVNLGNGVLNGVSDPTPTTGRIGDFFINTNTTTLYGPKTSAGWGTGVNISTEAYNLVLDELSTDNGASLIGFIQDIPSAIHRTQQSKSSENFSIFDVLSNLTGDPVENRNKIQAILDEIGPNGYIIFPSTLNGSKIQISGTLYFYDNQVLDGQGLFWIEQVGGAITTFAPKKIGVARTSFVTFKGLQITNSDISLWNNPLCIGLDLQEVSHFKIEDCRIRDHHTNIKHGGVVPGVLGGYYNLIFNTELANAFVSIDSIDNGTSTRVIGGRIHSNRYGMRLKSLSDITLNTAFERNRIGLYVGNAVANTTGNCRWEGNNRNQAISNIIVSSGIATVTSTRHFLQNGDIVIVTGSSVNQINGIKTISNVTSTTYQIDASDAPDGNITDTISITLVNGGAVFIEKGVFGVDVSGHFSGGSDRVISRDYRNISKSVVGGLRISQGSGIRNLLDNGDFSIDSNTDGLADGWTISPNIPSGLIVSLDSTVKATGTVSQKLQVLASGTSQRHMSRLLKVVPGVIYSYNLNYFSDTANNWSFRIGSSINDSDLANIPLIATGSRNSSDAFDVVSGTFIPTNDNVYITIYMNTTTAAPSSVDKNLWLNSLSIVPGIVTPYSGSDKRLVLPTYDSSSLPLTAERGEVALNISTDELLVFNGTSWIVKG